MIRVVKIIVMITNDMSLKKFMMPSILISYKKGSYHNLSKESYKNIIVLFFRSLAFCNSISRIIYQSINKAVYHSTNKVAGGSRTAMHRGWQSLLQ